jgi:hypothetical protein
MEEAGEAPMPHHILGASIHSSMERSAVNASVIKHRRAPKDYAQSPTEILEQQIYCAPEGNREMKSNNCIEFKLPGSYPSERNKVYSALPRKESVGCGPSGWRQPQECGQESEWQAAQASFWDRES